MRAHAWWVLLAVTFAGQAVAAGPSVETMQATDTALLGAVSRIALYEPPLDVSAVRGIQLYMGDTPLRAYFTVEGIAVAGSEGPTKPAASSLDEALKIGPETAVGATDALAMFAGAPALDGAQADPAAMWRGLTGYTVYLCAQAIAGDQGDVAYEVSSAATDEPGTLAWEVRGSAEMAPTEATVLEWLDSWSPGAPEQAERLARLSPEELAAAQDLFSQADRAATEWLQGPADQPLARLLIAHSEDGLAVTAINVELAWPLLAPVFVQSRAKAEQTSCMSNLKQIGLGMLMYAQDHDEDLPPADNWRKPVLDYLRNEQVFLCPADAQQGAGIGLSYFYNAKLDKRNLARIARPAEVILMADGRPGSGGPERLVARHDGGVNAVFADGHAKWLPLETAQDPRLWTP